MLSYALLIWVIISVTVKLFVISAEPELLLVNVVFRHGDRATNNGSENYPTDPHLYRDYLVNPGDLTHIGRKRCETLGKHLHELYGGLVSNSYMPAEIYARGTAVYRTQECLKQALCAWYSEDPQLHDPVKGCQLEANFIDAKNDKLLMPYFSQAFQTEKKKVLELPETKSQIESYRELMQNLTTLTGKEIKTVVDLISLYNTFTSQSSQNWELPDWAKEIYPNGILSNAAILCYQLESWNPEIRRVNGGLFMRKMVNNMLAKVEYHEINERKIYLYSAHESHVASALITLGIFDPPFVPKYTSAVIIELLSRCNNHYVRVRYYEGIPAESRIITIPGCMELCPLQQFIKLIENNLASSEEVRDYC